VVYYPEEIYPNFGIKPFASAPPALATRPAQGGS